MSLSRIGFLIFIIIQTEIYIANGIEIKISL